MSEPIDAEGVEISSPPSKTAGEEDHSDPDVFRGEEAPAPENPGPVSDGTGPEGEV